MATLPNSHHENWLPERTGYEDRRVVAYAPGDTERAHSFRNWTAWEAHLGNLVVAAGAIWAAGIFFSSSPASLMAVWQSTGPRETIALGLLMWLHAKWQRSTTLR